MGECLETDVSPVLTSSLTPASVDHEKHSHTLSTKALQQFSNLVNLIVRASASSAYRSNIPQIMSSSSSQAHNSSKDNDRPDPQSTEGIATPVDIKNNNHSTNSNTSTSTPPANRGRNEQELLYSTDESSSSSSSSESLVGTNKNNIKRREYGGDQKRPALVVVPGITNQSGKFIDLVANASPLSQLEIDSSIADFVQESLLPPPQLQQQQQSKKQQLRHLSLPTAPRKSQKKVVPKNFRIGNTTSTTTTAVQHRKKPPHNTLTVRKKPSLPTAPVNRHTPAVVATKKSSTAKTQRRSSAETNLAKILIAVGGRTIVMNHSNENENRMDNNGNNNNNNEVINGNDAMDSTSESSAYDDDEDHHNFNQTNSSHASAEDVIDEMWPTLSKVSQRLLSNEDNHRVSTWSSLQQQHAPNNAATTTANNNNNNNNNPSTITTATKSRRGGHVASFPTKGTAQNMVENRTTTTSNNRKRKNESRNNNNNNETDDTASRPNYPKKTANVYQGSENERFAQQPYHPDAAMMNHHHHLSSSPFYPFASAGTNPPHSSYSPYLHHSPHNNTMSHLLPTTYSTAENNNNNNSATQITGTTLNHPNNNSNSNSSNNSSNNNNNAKSILALRERMHTFASAYPQQLHHVTNELPPSASITYQEYLTGSLNSTNDNMNMNPYATIATTTAPITRTTSTPTANVTNARRKQGIVTTTKSEDLYESKIGSGNSMASNKSLNSAEGIHRRLVSAIFEIGISHASPAVIMENMVFPTNPAPDMTDAYGRPHDLADDEYVNAIANQVTSERVKSHLQKYRKNKQKNKDDFLREYDQWTQNALQSIGGFPTAIRTNLVNSPIAVLEMIKSHTGNKMSRPALHQHMGGDPTKLLLGGELPAYLTFSVTLEEAYRAHAQSINHDFVDDFPYRQQQQKHQHQIQQQQQIHSRLQMGRLNENSSDESSTIISQVNGLVADPADGALAPVITQQMQPLSSASEYTQHLSGAKVILPTLTEEESQSSLGVSISHVIGLFYSMSHALIKERKRRHNKNAPAAAPPLPSSVLPTTSDQQRNDFSNTIAATDNNALPLHTNRQQHNLTPTRGNSSGPKAHMSDTTAYDLTESPESTKKTTKTIRKLVTSVSTQPQEKHASLQGRPNTDNSAYNNVNENSGSLAALNRNTNALSAIGLLHNMQQQPSRGIPPSSLYHAYPLPQTQPQPHGYAVPVPQHQHPQQQQQQYSQPHALQQQHYNSSTGLVAAGGMGMMGRYAYHPAPPPPPQYLPTQGQQHHEPPQRHWEHNKDNDNADYGKNT